jgi:hypothetical protein
MEVDYGTLTECKESGDGALLLPTDSNESGSEDFPMQIDQSQLNIS